jgi:hypothetical protein
MLGHQSGDGALSNVDAGPQELTVIRGAPQSGFAAAMRVTRALISALTGGRLSVGRPETLVQGSRKRRCCHRRTVSDCQTARFRDSFAHTAAVRSSSLDTATADGIM